MESEIISHCVGPLSRDFLSKCLHHVAPCYNLHSGFDGENVTESLVEDIFKVFPFSSSMPIPSPEFTKLSRKAINGIDPTTVLIRDKIRWQMKKEQLIKAVQRDKKSINLKKVEKALKKSVGKEVSVPGGVALLARHLDADPDPNFAGASNWYYTGGTLATIQDGDEHYLLRAHGWDINCSRIVEGSATSGLSSTLHLDNEEPVHQIVTNARGAAVRQASRVNVLSWDNVDGNSVQLTSVFNASDKKHRLVSVALPGGSLRNVSTISNTRVLKLWDIEYSKRHKQKVLMQPGDGAVVSDNWSTLKYLDRRTLLLADRCCVYILDPRASMKEKQQAWCTKKLREECEEQCNLLCSGVNDQSVYVATTHQLLCLDVRQGFNQRWTHLMAAAPHLGFTYHMDDEYEVVCLGSQILSDCVAVVNVWKDNRGQSSYKPTSLPSPAQGLHLARQHGECLDPSLTQRCTQSMTGLTFVPLEKGVHVARQSATGDVFIQELSSSRKFIKQLTELELMMYSQWSKPTLKLPQAQDECTSVTSTCDFHSIYKEVTRNLQDNQQYFHVEERSRALVGTSYQMSKEYMEDCVDLLAGKMLAVWQVEEEDEWVQETETLTEQDPGEKVLSWLHTTDINTDKTLPSSLNPPVASTPHPLKRKDEVMSEPSPWMTQPSQILRPTQYQQVQSGPNFSDNVNVSPAPSIASSSRQRRKKQKLLDNTILRSSNIPVDQKQFHTDFTQDLTFSTAHFVASGYEDEDKHMICEDLVLTPAKKPIVKKPVSTQKKKFIPGF